MKTDTSEKEQIRIAFEHWLYCHHLPDEPGIVTERGIEARREAFEAGFLEGINWLCRTEGNRCEPE